MILVPEGYKNHPTLSIKYPEVILVDISTFGLKHEYACGCIIVCLSFLTYVLWLIFYI